MSGLSTMGSISFGIAFVAGRNLVPKPATGSTAFRTRFGFWLMFSSVCPIGDDRMSGHHKQILAGKSPGVSGMGILKFVNVTLTVAAAFYYNEAQVYESA